MKLLRRTLSGLLKVWRLYSLYDLMRDSFDDFFM
jgi:hypothetical protein